MARRKREPMSEGKKNIIAELIEEYDIRTAKDIEDALRDLMGGTIQEMLEAELDEHLGYRSYERSDSSNYRNGKKTKKIRNRQPDQRAKNEPRSTSAQIPYSVHHNELQ